MLVAPRRPDSDRRASMAPTTGAPRVRHGSRRLLAVLTLIALPTLILAATLVVQR